MAQNLGNHSVRKREIARHSRNRQKGARNERDTNGLSQRLKNAAWIETDSAIPLQTSSM